MRGMTSLVESLAPTAATPTTVDIAMALSSARTAEECLLVAAQAEALGAVELQRKCLERAIALDRNCQPALLALAALSMDDGDPAMTFALLEETDRAGLLPESVRSLHEELLPMANADERLEGYLRLIGRVTPERPTQSLSIVLITNLFPPQELGGYGRMMWEFAQGLIARGHSVRVLTSDATQLGKAPTSDEVEMERNVFRTLQLAGTWEAGRAVQLRDRNDLARRLRDNAMRIRTAVTKQKADLVLAGNLDFLTITALRAVFERGVPVLHALANATPGYSVTDQPRDAAYWVAPCSDWNGDVFKQAGFTPARIETLYPGARVDRFFRLFLPDTQRLRICYASLVLPYKGADTLVRALARLHDAGIDFNAEIAGDTPDGAFLTELQALVSARGMEAKVTFPGFLDRRKLSALFARSNVLVFPSRFQEPFGISQVEALAAGLVVVSSGTGGAKEIIRDDIDGLLFAAGDEAGLAHKLTMLAERPDTMSRLQRGGQARARTFSVENAVLNIERLAGEMKASTEALMSEGF